MPRLSDFLDGAAAVSAVVLHAAGNVAADGDTSHVRRIRGRVGAHRNVAVYRAWLVAQQYTLLLCCEPCAVYGDIAARFNPTPSSFEVGGVVKYGDATGSIKDSGADGSSTNEDIGKARQLYKE